MLDPIALLTAEGLTAVSEPTRMNGADAAVWRVETHGRTVALRVVRPGRNVEHEVAAQRTAAGLGVPAPHVLTHGVFQRHPFTITSWMPGRTLGDVLKTGGDPHRAGVVLGRVMGALHAPSADGTVLCHGDLHPLNLLVSADEVTGVVDWADAHRGDAREDIAATRVVLQFAPAIIPDFAEIAPLVADGFDIGYAQLRPLCNDDELRPFARRAARRQYATWTKRARQGAAPESAAFAARRVLDGWLRR